MFLKLASVLLLILLIFNIITITSSSSSLLVQAQLLSLTTTDGECPDPQFFTGVSSYSSITVNSLPANCHLEIKNKIIQGGSIEFVGEISGPNTTITLDGISCEQMTSNFCIEFATNSVFQNNVTSVALQNIKTSFKYNGPDAQTAGVVVLRNPLQNSYSNVETLSFENIILSDSECIITDDSLNSCEFYGVYFGSAINYPSPDPAKRPTTLRNLTFSRIVLSGVKIEWNDGQSYISWVRFVSMIALYPNTVNINTSNNNNNQQKSEITLKNCVMKTIEMSASRYNPATTTPTGPLSSYATGFSVDTIITNVHSLFFRNNSFTDISLQHTLNTNGGANVRMINLPPLSFPVPTSTSNLIATSLIVDQCTMKDISINIQTPATISGNSVAMLSADTITGLSRFALTKSVFEEVSLISNCVEEYSSVGIISASSVGSWFAQDNPQTRNAIAASSSDSQTKSDLSSSSVVINNIRIQFITVWASSAEIFLGMFNNFHGFSHFTFANIFDSDTKMHVFSPTNGADRRVFHIQDNIFNDQQQDNTDNPIHLLLENVTFQNVKFSQNSSLEAEAHIELLALYDEKTDALQRSVSAKLVSPGAYCSFIFRHIYVNNIQAKTYGQMVFLAITFSGIMISAPLPPPTTSATTENRPSFLILSNVTLTNIHFDPGTDIGGIRVSTRLWGFQQITVQDIFIENMIYDTLSVEGWWPTSMLPANFFRELTRVDIDNAGTLKFRFVQFEDGIAAFYDNASSTSVVLPNEGVDAKEWGSSILQTNLDALDSSSIPVENTPSFIYCSNIVVRNLLAPNKLILAHRITVIGFSTYFYGFRNITATNVLLTNAKAFAEPNPSFHQVNIRAVDFKQQLKVAEPFRPVVVDFFFVKNVTAEYLEVSANPYSNTVVNSVQLFGEQMVIRLELVVEDVQLRNIISKRSLVNQAHAFQLGKTRGGYPASPNSKFFSKNVIAENVTLGDTIIMYSSAIFMVDCGNFETVQFSNLTTENLLMSVGDGIRKMPSYSGEGEPTMGPNYQPNAPISLDFAALVSSAFFNIKNFIVANLHVRNSRADSRYSVESSSSSLSNVENSALVTIGTIFLGPPLRQKKVGLLKLVFAQLGDSVTPDSVGLEGCKNVMFSHLSLTNSQIESSTRYSLLAGNLVHFGVFDLESFELVGAELADIMITNHHTPSDEEISVSSLLFTHTFFSLRLQSMKLSRLRVYNPVMNSVEATRFASVVQFNLNVTSSASHNNILKIYIRESSFEKTVFSSSALTKDRLSLSFLLFVSPTESDQLKKQQSLIFSSIDVDSSSMFVDLSLKRNKQSQPSADDYLFISFLDFPKIQSNIELHANSLSIVNSNNNNDAAMCTSSSCSFLKFPFAQSSSPSVLLNNNTFQNSLTMSSSFITSIEDFVVTPGSSTTTPNFTFTANRYLPAMIESSGSNVQQQHILTKERNINDDSSSSKSRQTLSALPRSTWTFACTNVINPEVLRSFETEYFTKNNNNENEMMKIEHCVPPSRTRSLSNTSGDVTPTVELPVPKYTSPLRETSNSVIVAASVLQVFSSSTMVMTGSRTRSIFRIARSIMDGECGAHSSDLEDAFDFASSPFGMYFEQGGYASGAVVGNVLFIVAVFAVFVGGYTCYLKFFGSKKDRTKPPSSRSSHQSSRAALPHLQTLLVKSQSLTATFFASMLVLGPSLESSVLLAAVPSVPMGWKITSILIWFAIFFVVIFCFLIIYKLLYKRKQLEIYVKSKPLPENTSSIKRLILFLAQPIGEWVLPKTRGQAQNYFEKKSNHKNNHNSKSNSSDENNNRATSHLKIDPRPMRYSEFEKRDFDFALPFIEGYNDRFRLFFVVDLILTFILSLCVFTSSDGDSLGCLLMAIIACASLGIYGIITVIFRPNAEFITQISSAGFSLLCCAFLALTLAGVEENIFAIVMTFIASLQLVASIIALLGIFFTLAQAINRMLQKKKQTKKSINNSNTNRRRLGDFYEDDQEFADERMNFVDDEELGLMRQSRPSSSSRRLMMGRDKKSSSNNNNNRNNNNSKRSRGNYHQQQDEDLNEMLIPKSSSEKSRIERTRGTGTDSSSRRKRESSSNVASPSASSPSRPSATAATSRRTRHTNDSERDRDRKDQHHQRNRSTDDRISKREEKYSTSTRKEPTKSSSPLKERKRADGDADRHQGNYDVNIKTSSSRGKKVSTSNNEKKQQQHFSIRNDHML